MVARVLKLALQAQNNAVDVPLTSAERAGDLLVRYTDLHARAFALVGDDVTGCTLTYLDVDGDNVTLASDRDLQELLQYMVDESLENVTVVVKPNHSVVQSQLKGLVSAMTKLTKHLEVKEKKLTAVEALAWITKSVVAWEVSTDAPELAAIRDDVLEVLSDAEFCKTMEELSESSEFKELVDEILNAIFKKDESVIDELLSARFDALFAFAQRILTECPKLKDVLIRLMKRCAACLLRYNAGLLDQASEDVQTVETVSVAEDCDVSDTTSEASASGLVHENFMCDGCSVMPIVGSRYRSSVNPNMDLCTVCFSSGAHTETCGPFVEVTSLQALHMEVTCDGCDMSPIVGVRYKALNERDFDLCESCEASGKWDGKEPFIKINSPSRAPKSKREDTIMHPFVTCDDCEMSPIVGTRFKSTVVRNFDLCEACEASGRWTKTHAPFATIEGGDFRGAKAWFKFGEGRFKKHRGHHGHGRSGHHEHGRSGHHEHGRSGHHEHGRSGHHGRHGRHGHRHGHHHEFGFHGPLPPPEFGVFGAPPHPHPHPHPPHHDFGGKGRCSGINIWRENVQLQARFVEDVTIPDGCAVSPLATLRKSWKLENSGDEAWPQGCYMVIQAGNPTCGIQTDASEITLPALQPGEQCIADVDVLAPAVPGRYTTYWRVCDPSGIQFGHRFWIDIIVATNDAEIISHATALSAETEQVENIFSSEASHSDEVDATAAEVVEIEEDDDASTSSSDSESDSSSDSASDSGSDSASDISSEAGDDNDDADDDDVEIVGVRVAASTESDQYADALVMLASMGFEDEAKNRRHLDSAEGNITNAVLSLLTE